MSDRAFELICEIEPQTCADLTRVRHPIGVMSPIADIGRATVPSVALAYEVQATGAAGIACLKSRDRKLLGLQRDLLTAAAYGMRRFLFVYGDNPAAGGRTSELTVRAMVKEARGIGGSAVRRTWPFQIGVAAGLLPVPGWKRAADFVFAQVSFSLDALLRWREAVLLGVPVYAGVLVLASAGMSRNLVASIPDIEIPDSLVAVEADGVAGVTAACEQVLAIRASGAFDGVHLVPVSRYRQVAKRLEGML